MVSSCGHWHDEKGSDLDYGYQKFYNKVPKAHKSNSCFSPFCLEIKPMPTVQSEAYSLALRMLNDHHYGFLANLILHTAMEIKHQWTCLISIQKVWYYCRKHLGGCNGGIHW